MIENKPNDDDWNLDPTQKILDLTEDLFSSEPNSEEANEKASTYTAPFVKTEELSTRSQIAVVSDADGNVASDGPNCCPNIADMTQSLIQPAADTPVVMASSCVSSNLVTPKRNRQGQNQNANYSDYRDAQTLVDDSSSLTTTGSSEVRFKRSRLDTSKSGRLTTVFRPRIAEQLCKDKNDDMAKPDKSNSVASGLTAMTVPLADTNDHDSRLNEEEVLCRRIGAVLAQKDSDRLSFSERNMFSRCEIVAVARSGDRFNYGQVLSDSGTTLTLLICESPPLKKQLPYVLTGKIRCETMESGKQMRLCEILNSSEEIYSYLKCQSPQDDNKPISATLLNIAHFILMFNMRLLHRLGSAAINASSNPITSANALSSPPPLPASILQQSSVRPRRCLQHLIQKQSEAWKLQLDALKQQAS